MEEQLTLLDRAILFAVKAHAGAVRRDGHTPYILHCTEAAAIAATMTQEPMTIPLPKNQIITSATNSLAPEEIPSTKGPAMGFAKKV